MIVEIVEWDSGEWVKVYLDGKLFHSDHDIPNHKWVQILQKCGASVKTREVETDEYGEAIGEDEYE